MAHRDRIGLEAIPAYITHRGAAYCGDSRELLNRLPDGSINLVMTSPPFALQRKKEYGNKDQDEYIDWLVEFARLVQRKLRDDGSFVLDLGGAYQKGIPARSLYNFRVPIRFCDELGFFLASDRMKKLLKDPDGFYSPKKRPSGHDIGRGFKKENKGAIPSNLLQIANSESNGKYSSGCKAIGTKQHPARFPAKLPEFFIRFLTDPGDLVVDIFAGSNTTGWVAEKEGRQWLAFDKEREYLASSSFRFLADNVDSDEIQALYDEINAGKMVELGEYMQADLFLGN